MIAQPIPESGLRDGDEDAQRKLTLLIRTGLLLANSMDLQSMLQATTDTGLELCGAEFGAFFYNVANADGESYLLYTISGVDRQKFDQFPMPRNTEVFASTFGGTGIVRSGDITKDPRYGKNSPHFGMPEGHLPVRSYLAVPVKTQSGEVLGGLFYGHKRPDVFGPEVEDLVATMAVQAASAIENFRLKEQLTRKIEDLERVEAQQREGSRNMSELAAIVESSDDAIISKDLTGTIRSWNHASSRIFGYSREEIVGRSILTLIPKELHAEEQMILEKIRSGERIDHYETVRLTKDGSRLEVLLSISPIRDASGTIVGASKILRDISERKRMEKSLLQAEKIAATGRMAATIAHEINNPLEAVVNLLYLARFHVTDPTVASYLKSAESEVTRVSHIARQTLGFYRDNVSARAISIAELASDAIEIYGPKCHASGIRIETDLSSTKHIVLRRGEIVQVVSNLIANAIYAMPSGGTLSISTEDTALPQAGVMLRIKDDGTGIAPEQLSRIFEAFYTTRGSIGTGIGLFIAKQFVEGHGGSIEVESSIEAETRGTMMSIFLPEENPYTTAMPSAAD